MWRYFLDRDYDTLVRNLMEDLHVNLVLDMACGCGNMVRRMLPNVQHLVGLDLHFWRTWTRPAIG
jgi:predicted TPR repeat methyltransferase